MPITEHKWKLLESTTTKKKRCKTEATFVLIMETLSFRFNNGKKINKEVTNFSSFNFLKFWKFVEESLVVED